MGDFQVLTHTAPKQQFVSPPHILVFSGAPPLQLTVCQSRVGVSEGWDRMEQVEGRVGKQPGGDKTSFSFPLALPFMRRGRSQHGKGRKHGQTRYTSFGDPGLWPGDTHLPHQPVSACASPGASCDPFVSETITGQRKVSGAAPSHPGLGRVLRIPALMAEFYIVAVHARARRVHEMENTEQGQNSQLPIPI